MNRYKRIVNHWFPMSPDEVAGGAAASVAAAVTQPAPVVEPAQPSKSEWVDLHKTLREQTAAMKAIADGMKPKEAPKPEVKPDASAELAATNAKIDAMMFENGFVRAMAKAKISEDHPAYELIEKVAKLEKPTDLPAFIAKYQGLIQPTAAPVIPVVAPIAKSDTGAAVAKVTDSGTPDGHPYRWPPEVIAKMSPEQLRTAAREFENKSSGSASVLEVFEARRNRAKNAEAKK